MAWNDFYKHYGWKSPPPQRGMGPDGRAALDLKGVLFYFGFVWGLLIFMTGLETFWFFVMVWGLLSFFGLFSDTYPRVTRYLVILVGVAIGGLALAGMYISEPWSANFVGATMIGVYATIAITFCANQLRTVGGV